MKYLILVLALIISGCAKDEPASVGHQVRLPCGCESQPGHVELEEIMIEIQNNPEECAVRVWSRTSDRPLFEVKGGQGIHNCKVYIIQNPEIKSKRKKR